MIFFCSIYKTKTNAMHYGTFNIKLLTLSESFVSNYYMRRVNPWVFQSLFNTSQANDWPSSCGPQSVISRQVDRSLVRYQRPFINIRICNHVDVSEICEQYSCFLSNRRSKQNSTPPTSVYSSQINIFGNISEMQSYTMHF